MQVLGTRLRFVLDEGVLDDKLPWSARRFCRVVISRVTLQIVVVLLGAYLAFPIFVLECHS